MLNADHPPEWPDKLMFAAMLVVIAGILGTLFALLRLVGTSFGADVWDILLAMPWYGGLALSLLMIGLGAYAVRHQAAVWVWAGVVAGFASLGMLGFVPLLCVIAVVFLLMSRAEGEETTHDEHTVDASLWPDKAFAASLLLFVGALVSLFQAGLLFIDNMATPLFPDQPLIMATLASVAGLWGLYAARELYHVRRAWTGHVAVLLGVAAMGFWVAGPAIALAAFVLLLKAHGEKEFERAPAAAPS